jgi:hypothetical protein
MTNATNQMPGQRVQTRNNVWGQSCVCLIPTGDVCPRSFARETRASRVPVCAEVAERERRHSSAPLFSLTTHALPALDVAGSALLAGLRARAGDVAELAAVVALGAEAAGRALGRDVAEVAAVEALLAAAGLLGGLGVGVGGVRAVAADVAGLAARFINNTNYS